MITGNENLLQIAETDADLIPLFEKQGLGSYFKTDNLKKIGKFTKLNSLLKSKNIQAALFIESLNQHLNHQKVKDTSDISTIQHSLHFAAMLPCGLRNPYKEYFESYIQNHTEEYPDLNYLIEGNVNHELSYYPILDSIENEEELPDIIIASDVNNFFHRPFTEKFIDKGYFKTYTPYQPNEYLEKTHYADPRGNFTMITANMLIIVVDQTRLGDRKKPEKWEDLLNPAFENDIIMRGEDDFFCNAVMLPFFKDKGFDAVRILANNIKSGMHPAEMVKLASNHKKEGACIYIMPYFFAQRLKNPNAHVVWPSDGAIVSPVFMLVKKGKEQKHKALLDFLIGKETGELMVNRYFPSIHPEVSNNDFPAPAKWLGWDFLNQNDIGQLKEDIRTEFMKVWSKKQAVILNEQ